MGRTYRHGTVSAPRKYTKRKLLVWVVNRPRLNGGCIGPRTETCVNWGCPIAMVPCLQQGNICMKRKLRVWRDRKCISLVGTKTPLTCAGRYRAENGNLRKLGWTYHHGTVFAPRQYLYEKEATGMERPEMYSPSWCKNPTYLCGPSNYTVSRLARWLIFKQYFKAFKMVTAL